MIAKRVVQVGLGTIGCAIAELVTERDDLLLVGAVDPSPERANRDLAEILQADLAEELTVDERAESALERLRPDIVFHSTGSRLDVVVDQIITALELGCDVVSTCEELAYPFESHPEHSARIDAAAKSSGTRVLGTGVNPGFVMDALPAMLSVVCRRVDRLTVTRVVDTATRRPQLRAKTGAGLSVDDFRRRVQLNQLGHVGLVGSLQMLAGALGWNLTAVHEDIRERTTKSRLIFDDLDIPADGVIGLHQTAVGQVAGMERVVLDLTMEIGAQDPRDEIVLEGEPSLTWTAKGGVAGDVATASVVVNVATRIRTLEPGLHTMLDLIPGTTRGA